LQFKRADIAWGNLFADDSKTPYVSFSLWHTLDSFCVVVPKRKNYPKIMSLILPFDWYVWIGLTVSISMFLLVLALYATVHQEK
jgi:hypothetical protein